MNGAVSSPINDDLPWLIRRPDEQSDDVFSDGDPPSSSSTTLDPDTVVPAPGSVHRQRPQAADCRPDTVRGRRGLPRRLHTASATDKFDERDEEMMSPLSWQPPPAPFTVS